LAAKTIETPTFAMPHHWGIVTNRFVQLPYRKFSATNFTNFSDFSNQACAFSGDGGKAEASIAPAGTTSGVTGFWVSALAGLGDSEAMTQT
jgi:hypothetical protein